MTSVVPSNPALTAETPEGCQRECQRESVRKSVRECQRECQRVSERVSDSVRESVRECQRGVRESVRKSVRESVRERDVRTGCEPQGGGGEGSRKVTVLLKWEKKTCPAGYEPRSTHKRPALSQTTLGQ
jgi:hypothetical protein